MLKPSQQPARLVPQPEAIALLPVHVATAHTLLPLRVNDRQLICAGPGPFDLDFLSQLQFQVQRHLTLVRVPEEIFAETFERHYGSRLVPQAPALLNSLCSAPPKLKHRAGGAFSDWAKHPCQTTAVIGASGGVGATSITANLAVLLSEQNLNVAFLDANFSAPAAHICLGVKPAYTIRDLKRGRANAWETFAAAGGIRLIAGEPGAADCANLTYSDLAELGATPDHLAEHFDHYLIDLPHAPSESQLGFAARANRVVIVLTEEPAVLHNALALAKSVFATSPSARMEFLFNQVAHPKEARNSFLKLRGFLGDAPIHFAGAVPVSKHMQSAWSCRTPLAQLRPRDAAVKSLGQIQAAMFPPVLQVSGAEGRMELAQSG